MATASAPFKSREDHHGKQIELDEGDGKEINPKHIPRYITSAPWYLKPVRSSLKHQRKLLCRRHTEAAFDKGQDVHEQAARSELELLHKNSNVMKDDKLTPEMKEAIIKKYSIAGQKELQELIPRVLQLGQSERQLEYDHAGRIIKGWDALLPISKDEEPDIWGSWFWSKPHPQTSICSENIF